MSGSSSLSLFSKNHPRRAAMVQQPPARQSQKQQPSISSSQPLSFSTTTTAATTTATATSVKGQAPPQLELVSQYQHQQQQHHQNHRQQQHSHHHSHSSRQHQHRNHHPHHQSNPRDFKYDSATMAPSPSMANATVVTTAAVATAAAQMTATNAPLPSSLLWPAAAEDRQHRVHHHHHHSKKKKKSILFPGGGGADDTRSSASTTAVTQQRQEHQRRLLSKVLHQSQNPTTSSSSSGPNGTNNTAPTGTARSATSAGGTSLFSNPQEQRAFLSRLLQMDSFQKDMNPTSTATSHPNNENSNSNNNDKNHHAPMTTHDDQKKKLRRLLQQKLHGKKEVEAENNATAASTATTTTSAGAPAAASSSSSAATSLTKSSSVTTTTSNKTSSATTTSSPDNENATNKSSSRNYSNADAANAITTSSTKIDLASAQKRLKTIQQLRQDAVSIESSQLRLKSRAAASIADTTTSAAASGAASSGNVTSSATTTTGKRPLPTTATVAGTGTSTTSVFEMVPTTTTTTPVIPPILSRDPSKLPPTHPASLRMMLMMPPPPSSSSQSTKVAPPVTTSSTTSSNNNTLWTTTTATTASTSASMSSDSNNSLSDNSHASSSTNSQWEDATNVDAVFFELSQSLKLEVSNDHDKLWGAFQNVFMGQDYDRDGEDNARQRKSSTRYKLDTNAKDWLTAMNAHLKRTTVVECVKEAQLVNDKKVAKEMAAAAAATNIAKVAASSVPPAAMPSSSSSSSPSRPVLMEVNEQDTARVLVPPPPLSPQPVPTRLFAVIDDKENQQHSYETTTTTSVQQAQPPPPSQVTMVEPTTNYNFQHPLTPTKQQQQPQRQILEEPLATSPLKRPETVDEDDDKEDEEEVEEGDEFDEDEHFHDTAPMTATQPVIVSPQGTTTAPTVVTFLPPDLLSTAAYGSIANSTVVSQSPDTSALLEARSSSSSNNSEDDLMNSQVWKQSEETQEKQPQQLISVPLPLPPPPPQLTRLSSSQPDAFAIAQFAKRQVDRLHSLLDQHQQQEQQQQQQQQQNADQQASALPLTNKPMRSVPTTTNAGRKDPSSSKTTVLTLRMALNKQKASLAGTKRRLLVDTTTTASALAHPPPPGPSWSEVKLKRPTTLMESGPSETTPASAPWVGVKLRAVAKKEVAPLTPPRPVSRWLTKSLADTEDEDDEDEDEYKDDDEEDEPNLGPRSLQSDIEMTVYAPANKLSFHDRIEQESRNAAFRPASVEDSGPPVSSTHPPPHSKANDDPEDARLGIGRVIDLDSLPQLLSESGKFLVLNLAGRQGATAEAGMVVVVSRGIIMTLQSIQLLSSKHRVTWRSSRKRVETATLDLTSNRVDLALTQARPGTKSLFFKSAEDCLKFAKYFYDVEGHDNGDDAIRVAMEHKPVIQHLQRQVKEKKGDDAVTSTSSHVTQDLARNSMNEALSEEEQKVLEMYRRMRLTKGRDVAMQETIKGVTLTPPTAAAATTTTTLPARHLIKSMSSPSFEPPKHIPLPPPVSSSELVDILRERRQKNGVTPANDKAKHEDSNNTTTTTTTATTTTTKPTAESDESVADKYLKMLKVSIPLEAVKHKMMRDQVPDDVQQNIILQWEKQQQQQQQLSAPKSENNESSEVSSNKAPANGLTEEEEKIAAGYRKMLKLRVPPEAVRHKMTKDQVDPKIIMVVLDSSNPQPEESQQQKSVDSNAPNQGDVSDEDEAIASVYRKMLKLMVPADAVRHRMIKDQVDDRIITLVLGGDSNAPAKKLTSDEENLAEVYRKMLKLMIPADAVRHRMKKDQVDEKIILVVLGPDSTGAKQPKASKPVLTDEEDAVAETYRKMLKFRIPKDAVRHRMLKENVCQKIISAVLGDSDKASEAKGAPPGTKLVSLHWTPLSGDELDNSIWRASKKRKVTAARPEGNDISKLIQLFQKKESAKGNKTGATTRDPGQNDKAKLIDLNRANNVAISLKAFKDFTHSELAEIISYVDPMRKIGAERVQFIKDLLPSAAEAKALKEYDGPESKLVPAELWFRHIGTVERVESKVQVMRTMETFETDTTEIIRSFRLVANVCQQVMTSEKLQDLLEMILQIGNIMNEGTRTGGAAGFKFDSLLKLTQTKSSDGKTTVLDYLVTIFVAKGQRNTLLLSADFPDCQTASRTNVSDLLAEARAMESSLNVCKKELECLRKEESAQRVQEFMKRKSDVSFQDTQSEAAAGKGDFGNSTTGSNLLLDSIRSRNMAHETQSEAVAMNPTTLKQREKFLAALRAKKDEVRSRTDDITSPQSKQPGRGNVDENDNKVIGAQNPGEKSSPTNSLRGGVRRIESFLDNAAKIVATLEFERDEAIRNCINLSTYCGESGGERATASLLGVLSEFAVYLDQAVKKHDERVEADARRAAFEKKRQIHSPRKKDLPSSARKSKKSLVLVVNEMLKEASDKTKEDFTKGVVYPNPDEKLQEIYELERQTVTFVPSPKAMPPSGIPQDDILSAIKKRRQRSDMLRLQQSVSSSAFSSVASSDVFAATSSAITEVTSNLTYPRGEDGFRTPNKSDGERTSLKVHIRETGANNNVHMDPATGAQPDSSFANGMSTPKQPEGMLYSSMCCIYR